MIFKKCKYALKYNKNDFEIYRTVLNISQKYKKIDFPRNKNYKNAQTIPRLKAGLDTLVYSIFELGKLMIVFGVESCPEFENAKEKNYSRAEIFSTFHTRLMI